MTIIVTIGNNTDVTAKLIPIKFWQHWQHWHATCSIVITKQHNTLRGVFIMFNWIGALALLILSVLVPLVVIAFFVLLVKVSIEVVIQSFQVHDKE